MNKKSNFSISYITLSNTSVAVDESVLRRLRLNNSARPPCNINCTFDLLYNIVDDYMEEYRKSIRNTITDIIDEM